MGRSSKDGKQKNVNHIQINRLTSFVDLDGNVDSRLLVGDLLPEVLVELELLGGALEVVGVDVLDLGQGQLGVVLVVLDGVVHRALQTL